MNLTINTFIKMYMDGFFDKLTQDLSPEKIDILNRTEALSKTHALLDNSRISNQDLIANIIAINITEKDLLELEHILDSFNTTSNIDHLNPRMISDCSHSLSRSFTLNHVNELRILLNNLNISYLCSNDLDDLRAVLARFGYDMNSSTQDIVYGLASALNTVSIANLSNDTINDLFELSDLLNHINRIIHA